jgi:hypothetical protein
MGKSQKVYKHVTRRHNLKTKYKRRTLRRKYRKGGGGNWIEEGSKLVDTLDLKNKTEEELYKYKLEYEETIKQLKQKLEELLIERKNIRNQESRTWLWETNKKINLFKKAEVLNNDIDEISNDIFKFEWVLDSIDRIRNPHKYFTRYKDWE